ncbi:MAG: hypothetical protein IJH83_05715 [Coriobacteriales bacterium]|nr:hypothetical protein [Coriobacteriales bacterium]
MNTDMIFSQLLVSIAILFVLYAVGLVITLLICRKKSLSIGWALLGFLAPLVGLILFLVWEKERPADGKSAGIGALAGTIASLVFGVLNYIVVMAFIMMPW